MGEMHILKLREGEEYIKLGQALKATGLADSGIDAKEIIQQGLVLVNGEIDERRGRKLYDGDEVVFDDNKITVAAQCVTGIDDAPIGGRDNSLSLTACNIDAFIAAFRAAKVLDNLAISRPAPC